MVALISARSPPVSVLACSQSVLFKGSLLKPELELEEAGITDGDTVNIVPSKKPKAAASAVSQQHPCLLAFSSVVIDRL